MNFRDFHAAYNDGSIYEDASWRAYDIPAMASKRHAKDALKRLGYLDTTTLGFEQARHDLGIASAMLCRHLLAMWKVWTDIATGERRAGLIMKEGTDEQRRKYFK